MHGIPVTLTESSVDNAGDVNGDGVPDALIGGPACEADAADGDRVHRLRSADAAGPADRAGEPLAAARLPDHG